MSNRKFLHDELDRWLDKMDERYIHSDVGGLEELSFKYILGKNTVIRDSDGFTLKERDVVVYTTSMLSGIKYYK